MAKVALFRKGEEPQYLKSVSPTEFRDDPDALINPDVSAVSDVPLRYWKRTGNTIAEMSPDEKKSIDDALLAERQASADSFGVGVDVAIAGLIKVLNTKLPPDRRISKQEVVDALKSEIK